MNESDAFAKRLLKNLDELASEGNFGNEQNRAAPRLEGVSGEFEINVGFTTTGNTA